MNQIEKIAQIIEDNWSINMYGHINATELANKLATLDTLQPPDAGLVEALENIALPIIRANMDGAAQGCSPESDAVVAILDVLAQHRQGELDSGKDT